jgi:hypothetical protein
MRSGAGLGRAPGWVGRRAGSGAGLGRAPSWVGRQVAGRPRVRLGYSPLYACRPLNQSEPEYVTSTIPNPTTSSSAAGRPAHERWFRACR